jgi:hypothetical protein
MSIQYRTDEQGNRVAVVIPLAEWEALQERVREPNAETIAAMEDARKGVVPKPTLEDLAREWESATCGE